MVNHFLGLMGWFVGFLLVFQINGHSVRDTWQTQQISHFKLTYSSRLGGKGCFLHLHSRNLEVDLNND